MKTPILTYHSIDESGSTTSTPLSVFRFQMEHLVSSAYRSLGLSESLGLREDCERPTVVITFDDAYSSIEGALELLLESGLTATVFVPTTFCGKKATWADSRGDVMGWASLRRWAESGIELGSHSLDHVDLTRLDPGELVRQLADSRKRIEDRTSNPCKALAYPFGRTDASVRTVAQANYLCAVTTRLAWAGRENDPWALPRLDMYYFRCRTMWRHFDSLAGQVYVRMRALGRLLRGH